MAASGVVEHKGVSVFRLKLMAFEDDSHLVSFDEPGDKVGVLEVHLDYHDVSLELLYLPTVSKVL